MCHEQKEVNNEAVEEGQGLGSSEEYEPRFNEVTQDINTGPVGPVQVGEGLQIPQQQPQGNVRWDRFLPVRSLKVLLVENDDSTRHVVTALLRNCSYEVVAVGNGHQAWKILEDATNHIELVLTEVALPVLSGIGLLCKIVSHQNLKNIPVIMMSSHDSMSTVFKCLSKGAVDFLVKPIRKNELKNLWQHVWRRCHSSSGSGSESGTQTKKYVKSKGNDESENNSGSSEEHYGGSNGPSIRGGSDNGSGTQSSWTKRAAEDDRAQPTSPQTQWRDAPDSICAQVTDTKPEKHSNIEIHATEMKQFLEHADKLDNVSIGKDLELGVSKNLHLHYTYQQEKLPIHSTSKKQNRSTELDGKPFDNGQLEQNGENLTGRTRNQAPNVVGAVFNCANPHGETRNFEKTSRLCDNPQIKPEGDSEGLPSLELTLKRLGGVGNVGNIASEDRNVLRHSGLSAFSKYNSASSNQAPTANAGSCSPLENSPVAPNKATPLDFPSISNGTDTNHQPNENNCNNETTSTSKCTIPKPETINEKPESRSTFLPFHSSGASNSTQKAPMMGEDTKMVQAQATVRDSQPPVQVQHHHHHHHHYHHHLHSMQHHQPEQTENNDITLNNMEETAQHCGSSNDFGGNIESNAGNYSVNGSASGSNHVSNNGQNGNRIAVNAGTRNVESDNGVVGINSGSGVDKDRAAQREAALNKFRQKRKERCFEKKVRYHSRKKLAEQRPRIRGQFVRQIVSSCKEEKDCESKNVASGENSCDDGEQ